MSKVSLNESRETTAPLRSLSPGSALPRGRGWPLVLACIALLALMGWGYLAIMVADMVPAMDMSEAGPGMGLFNLFNGFAGLPAEARAALTALCLPTSVATFGMPTAAWTSLDVLKVFLMWLMMALAMMLPTATPMLRAYMIEKSRDTSGRPAAGQTLWVAMGYLSVWVGYAVVATLAQWVLTSVGQLSTMMAPLSLALTASILVAAGIYQFTPAKHACLQRCWYPRWVFWDHAGFASAYREGIVQGFACLGCCWAVMTVMFAVGIMNIVWIAVLGAIMAIEKTYPSTWFPRAIGLLCLCWGAVLGTMIFAAAQL